MLGGASICHGSLDECASGEHLSGIAVIGSH